MCTYRGEGVEVFVGGERPGVVVVVDEVEKTGKDGARGVHARVLCMCV